MPNEIISLEDVIDASQLVPGDIIRLEAGDFIPADARLLRSVSLKCEESALTGDSVPSEKDTQVLYYIYLKRQKRKEDDV